MTISNQSSGIRPGVCSSTTRPTAPFTGQIIYETDTGYLRVWDGSAWDYLSQKQDDTVGIGPTQGLVYVSGATLSGQIGVNIDNCFTSSFVNYRIEIDLNALSANDTIFMQWRTGGSNGSAYTTLDYDFQLLEANSTTITAGGTMGTNYHRLGFAYTSPGYFSCMIDVTNPQTAFRVGYTCVGWSPNSTTFVLHDALSGFNRTTTSMTGVRIGSLSGVTTLTGNVRIYGYRTS